MSRAADLVRLFFALFAVLVLVGPRTATAGVLQLTDNAVSETGTDVALDPTGGVHVVYERGGTIYYRGKTASGWSTEEAVATGTSPAVGAGASGIPQVAFLSGGSLWHTARVEGAWTDPVEIGPATTVDMAVDPNDVAHVVFLGNTDTSGDSANYTDLNYTDNETGTFPETPTGAGPAGTTTTAGVGPPSTTSTSPRSSL